MNKGIRKLSKTMFASLENYLHWYSWQLFSEGIFQFSHSVVQFFVGIFFLHLFHDTFFDFLFVFVLYFVFLCFVFLYFYGFAFSCFVF